jgi:AcrR family transcriptional regulator
MDQTRRLAMTTIAKMTGKITMEIPAITIGLDVGDKRSEALVIDRKGDVVLNEKIATRGVDLQRFFARFPAKEALLSALYARRHGMRQTQRGRSYLAHFLSRRMTLEERAREVVEQMVTYYGLNRHLLRSLGIPKRPTPSSGVPEAEAYHDAFSRGWTAAFLAHGHEIGHPDPERAVRIGLFMVASACREAIVLSTPVVGPDEMSAGELANELSSALVAYLRAG